MTTSERYQWNKKRKQGKLKFLLNDGVLRAGLPLSAVYYFILPLFSHRATVFSSPLRLVVSFLVFGMVVGVSCGLLLWFLEEHRYKKHR